MPDLNLLEMLTFLGAIQGVGLTAMLVISKKHRRLSNFVLAVFVGLFSLYIFREIFESHGYMANMDFIRAVSLTLVGYYGPLLYLYVLTLIGIKTRISGKQLLIFAPALCNTIIYAIFAFNGFTDWPQINQHPWMVYLVSSVQGLILLQNIVFIVLSFRWLANYRQWLKNNFSTIEKLGYNWLTRLLSTFVSLFVLWSLYFGADIRFLAIGRPEWTFDLFWLLISLFVYWIGYFSMLRPEILTEQFRKETKIRSSDRLSDRAIAEYKQALIALFEKDKIYLDPKLTLKQLAKSLDISDKKLSQVLNLGFNQTFYHLINRYRVEEVKRCLLNPQNSQSKLEVLAYEAGFKSSSTFNRQFKNITNMTPKAFRETCVG